jgi:hypothetical protein
MTRQSITRCSCSHRTDEHGDSCRVPNCSCDVSRDVLLGREESLVEGSDRAEELAHA